VAQFPDMLVDGADEADVIIFKAVHFVTSCLVGVIYCRKPPHN
jgi:hypothetical protein